MTKVVVLACWVAFSFGCSGTHGDLKPAEIAEMERIKGQFNATQAADGLHLSIPADLLFRFDESELRPDSAIGLGQIAKLIRHYPGAPVRVVGHTDDKGDEASNVRLSEERAVSVRRALIEHHAVDGSRITTAGLGEAQPARSNAQADGRDNPGGRRKNRRLEVVIGTK